MRDHREVAAPERAFAREVRAVERAFDFAAVAAEELPAMVERERRWRFGAEIEGGHRPRERRHAGVRERRELERGEVAVAHPSLARGGERGEIEAVDEPRPAVAAAHGDRELDAGIVRHPHRRRRGARHPCRRSAASASCTSGSTTTRWPSAGEPRRGAVDRLRLGREARRSEQPDAVTALAHWTTFVLRTPVFALVDDPERSC